MDNADIKEFAALQVEMKNVKENVSKLQTDVSGIKEDTTKILEKMLVLPQQYITVAAFELYKQEVNDSIRRATRRTWVQNTLSAALGIIFGAVCAAVFFSLFVKGAH